MKSHALIIVYVINLFYISGIASHANVVNLTNSLIFKQYPVTQCIQQRFFGAFSSTINKWGNVGNIKEKPIFG